MNSTIKVIVFGLGIPFGIAAFAICLSIGDNFTSAAIKASAWWAAFSASHALTYLAIKSRL